jgi:PTH1 family peptidyl-tRNA hydrolase
LSEPSLVIVGLGNPGPTYAKTRHNLGASFVEALARELSLSFSFHQKSKCHVASSSSVNLIIPECYMNESGIPVSSFMRFYKRDPKDLLVCYDDLDFPVGQARYAFGSGPGGHNGLKSINQHLGGQQYHKLRLGISRPTNKEEISSYVLNSFRKEDQSLIDELFHNLFRHKDLLISKNWVKWQQTFHTK